MEEANGHQETSKKEPEEDFGEKEKERDRQRERERERESLHLTVPLNINCRSAVFPYNSGLTLIAVNGP
mgnify:CR=1 FL=1